MDHICHKKHLTVCVEIKRSISLGHDKLPRRVVNRLRPVVVNLVLCFPTLLLVDNSLRATLFEAHLLLVGNVGAVVN